MELGTILQDNYLPRKIAIHDCVDTGNDYPLTSGQTYDLPIDCAVRNYKSTERTLFDNNNALIKDSIINNGINAKLKMVLYGAINNIVNVNIFIPHPTEGDIPVDNYELLLLRNNVDLPFSIPILLYNASDGEAHLYGFKIQLIATSGNTTLKARSILIKA